MHVVVNRFTQKARLSYMWVTKSRGCTNVRVGARCESQGRHLLV